MSADIPTSSSSRAIPPASPLPEVLQVRDPDPHLTPTAFTTLELEVVEETAPDESIPRLPRAPCHQSPDQPPGLVHRPARAELHAPDPEPALRSVPARPNPALTASLIERERALPAVPPNARLAPPREAASLRTRVVSDPSNVYAHRRPRRPDPPPAQPLELPGYTVFRQRLATHPGDFGSPDASPARVTSTYQSIGYHPPGSVGARLRPTLEEALKVRNGARSWAKLMTYSINIGIALQIVLGALTTALGASLHGNSIGTSVAALGSLATLVAAYLARTRNSSEPENSLLREQALNHFIRRLRSFILDSGMQEGHDQVVENFRDELERLLNPSDPNAKKNPLLFEPKDKNDNEAIDLDESKEDYRGRPRTKETTEGNHRDGVASNGRRPKGKGRVVDGSKWNEKHDGDGDGDGGTDTDADAFGNR